MLGTYFYHQIIRKTVTAFGTLFNDIYIEHKNSSDVEISKMKVPLGYGPMHKFLARIEQQSELNKPIQITLPRISFEMSSIQYDPTRKANITQTFKTCDNGDSVKKVYMPDPYNIGFQLNIMTEITFSGEEATRRLAVPSNRVFNCQTQIEAATTSFVREALASTLTTRCGSSAPGR